MAIQSQLSKVTDATVPIPDVSRGASAVLAATSPDPILSADPLKPAPAVPPVACRILLIEDNPGDARLIPTLLSEVESCQFELLHAECLTEGLAHLAVWQADVVLLDLALPDSTGLDTLLHVLEQSPDLPVVVLSDSEDEALALRAVQSGAQDYLAKRELSGRLLAHAMRYALERARLERERRELLRRERDARLVAQSAVRSRDELLAIVAHDLRSPLGAINITLGLLLSGLIPPEQLAHHLRVMQSSAGQLDRLIQDLLDIARIEGGTLRVEPRSISPARLLEDAADLLAAAVGDAGLDLLAEAAPRLPEVKADPARIMQVIGNLAGNAIRFTPRGGRISLRARRFGDSVLFSVSDTGVGIPSEELPHLFDSRWQVAHSRRDGTGRGLAISKGIIEAHHGRIWAASAVGEGTAFFFTLPLAEHERMRVRVVSTVRSSGRVTSPVASSAARAAGSLRIMVVDDHPAIRHGIVALLATLNGMEVVGEAGTGEEAFDRAERLRPDVVLMDLTMPGIGGIEATRRIVASMPGVRVLALSAEEEDEALMTVLRAGGSGFVRKTTAHVDLPEALATVARDEVFLYPHGNRLLLGEFLRSHGPERAALEGLNEQEQQVLLLAAEGFTSVEIGKKLFLSPKTIDTYRSRLMRQLGLSHRSDLTHFALKSGLLRPE